MLQPTGQRRCVGEISTDPTEGSEWNTALSPLLFRGAVYMRPGQFWLDFLLNFFFFEIFFPHTWSPWARWFIWQPPFIWVWVKISKPSTQTDTARTSSVYFKNTRTYGGGSKVEGLKHNSDNLLERYNKAININIWRYSCGCKWCCT